MADREKIIKSLETCSDVYYGATGACSSCSFSQSKNCFAELVHQTIVLLKEQEAEIENLKQTAQSMMEGICLLKEQDSVDHALSVLRANGWKEDRMYPEIVRCKDCKHRDPEDNMKAFVYKTSGMRKQGQIVEAETLETLCDRLLICEDFKRFTPELGVSRPKKVPYDEREKQCDWVIEIFDDYRE